MFLVPKKKNGFGPFSYKFFVCIRVGLYTKFDFTVDEGKEWLNPFREKNEGLHRRKKVDEKPCVAFLLCDPGWYVP